MPLRRVLTSTVAPAIVTALFTFGLLLNYDVGAVDLLAYALYLAVGISLPGVFAWRLLLTRLHDGETNGPTWFEDVSLGTIFGFGLQLPIYLLGVWIGFPLLIVALPIVAIAVSASPLGWRTWSLPTGSLDVRAAWALALTSIYGLCWLGRNIFAVRSLDLPTNRPPSIDETFHHALISETAHRFPPQIPFLLDTRLDYHWFVHAQIATSGHATGIDPITMLREVMPAVSLVLGVLGLGAVALRLTRHPLAAAVAPALLVFGAYQLMGPHYDAYQYYEPYLSRRFVSSPSQSYGVVISMPALMLILEVLRPGKRAGPMTWVALTLALFALSGAKATFMPVFLCGALAAWVLTLVFARRIDRTLSLLIGLLVVVNAFAQFVLFGGQGGGLAIDPFATVRAALGSDHIGRNPVSIAVMSLVLLTGWLLYGVGAFGLIKADRWRDPRAIWLVFSIPAGIGVAFVLYRSGLSQLWFQRTVAELVVLLSAWGLSLLIPSASRRQAWTYAGVAAGAGLVAFGISSLSESRRKVIIDATLWSLVATVVFPIVVVAVLAVVGLVLKRRTDSSGGHRWSASALCVCAILGLGSMNVYALGYDTVTQRARPQPLYPPLWARGGVTAAEYLDKHSSVHDIVATNIHCARPKAPECDNRNFWVSASTERRIVIEGWGYTATTNDNFVVGEANSLIPPPDPERLRLNDAAFRKPSKRTVQALVDAYDPSWLFVSKKYAANIKGLKGLDGKVLTKRFENANYIVFAIRGQ